ncbi:hypothetical protein ACFQRB_11605 [Halobaculum litoreum]|uniref:DNA replication factor GINS n=1 Tax=Halobaculum litoreum TaxID=3031998 RepID=A0ABD5XSY1_9EURY
MDLDELRSVQSKERRKDSLQHLRDSFYEDVAAYLAERKRQRDERAAEVSNPFSDKRVRKLSDEIETAEEVVESLYERRVGKVVKLSSFAAAGAPTDTEGMTVQEAELFEDLVVRIEQNKDRVLDVLENGADVDIGVGGGSPVEAEADAPAAAVGADAATGASATDASAPSSDAPAPPPDTPTDDDGGGVLADAMGGESPSAGADAGATAPDTAAESPPAPAEAPAGEPADQPAEPSDGPGSSSRAPSPTARAAPRTWAPIRVPNRRPTPRPRPTTTPSTGGRSGSPGTWGRSSASTASSTIWRPTTW